MKIRSITCFLNPGCPLDAGLLHNCASLLNAVRPTFEGLGYEVQTTRIATPPFAHFLPAVDETTLVHLAVELEKRAAALGIQYVSLGPALPQNLAHYQHIPAVIAATENVFLTGLMTTANGGVSLPAVRQCAEVIHQIAARSKDGFANLRFAALAGVEGGSPFFPAAYAGSDRPAFALALQAADLAVAALTNAASLAAARQNLIEAVERHAHALTRGAQPQAERYGFEFAGLDFTLAPFPAPEDSIGAALEQLGVPGFGRHGSLAAVAFLADTLDRARFQRTGFNGMMLPALEDAILAQRISEGLLTVKDLLMFSTVCGTGLDTIPLAGEVTADQLYALLLDLAVLAPRLGKPLTARLMPIPGKQTGDPTGFDFPFFANSRLMRLEAEPLQRLWLGEETLHLGRSARTAD